MAARFYAPDATASGDVVALPADEGEHLERVLRLPAGASVRVFDGRGREFHARVEAATRGDVRVRLIEEATAVPEPAVAITLAPAVLKGDKMDDVVRDAVMMGAAAVQPLLTARTEIALDTLRRGRRLDRWQRIAVASAKQCGRAVVPVVREPLTLADAIDAIKQGTLPRPALMLVEPQAQREPVPLRDLAASPPPAATLVIGPEGGWTAEEVRMAAVVCRPVSLGALTLRADAAPLVTLAACFTRWGVY